MIKNILIIILLAFFNNSNAQIEFFKNYYSDCISSSYTMNYAISLSMPEGNFVKANELLQTDFFKNDYEKSILIQSMLTHNTLGKDKAESLISSSNLNTEQQDFCKIWLSFYTNNPKFDSLKVNFQKKYPTNYHPIKLRLREILNYRDANIWNEIKDKKVKSIATIDSIINTKSITSEDKLFFSLTKLDFLKKRDFRSEDKEYSTDELLTELVELYKTNKSYFNLEILKNELNKSESNKFKEVISQINSELDQRATGSSTEKTLRILLNFNNSKDKISLSEVESSISKILSVEKNSNELNKAKAILYVFSLSKEPDLGFLMKGMLKPIPFSKSFKLSYSNTLTKPAILENIKTILKNPEFAEILNKSDQFNEELNTIKDMSIEDIQAFYGLIVFSSYYAKSLQGLKYAFGNYQDDPSQVDLKSVPNYINFLDKNPLYYDDSSYRFDVLEIKTNEDLFKFIESINELKNKLPGAATILKNGITTLMNNTKVVSENNLQNYYISYFKLVVDYLTISNIIKSKEQADVMFYNDITKNNTNYSMSYFEIFFNQFSSENKKEAENYLNTTITKNPAQKDLLEIKKTIQKSKGGIEYFDSYLNSLLSENRNNYENIDLTLIYELDSVYIDSKITKTVADLKLKKNYSALKKIIPIYNYISDIEKSTDLTIYILKNYSHQQNFNDDFSMRCIEKLYTEIYDDEKAITKLSKIEKEVPNFDINYLILAMLKLESEKEKEDGIKMIQKYNSIDFPNSIGYLLKYHYLKTFFKDNYFDEQNIELVLNEIIKKYPFLKEDFTKD